MEETIKEKKPAETIWSLEHKVQTLSIITQIGCDHSAERQMSVKINERI